MCFTGTSNKITFDKDTKIKSGPLIRATTSLVSISLKPVTYNYLSYLALPEECSIWLPNFVNTLVLTTTQMSSYEC